ncbi:C1q domain [Trinorchestia longiramus]|nr:C1q domain [Trinorchestia longiramus]
MWTSASAFTWILILSTCSAQSPFWEGSSDNSTLLNESSKLVLESASPLFSSQFDRSVKQLSIPSIAQLALESADLELQDASVEVTTKRSSRQISPGGILYRSTRLNPALSAQVSPTYNPYDPLSPRSVSVVPGVNVNTGITTFDTTDGLDAFTARRVSNSISLTNRIRFSDTVTLLGTSWDSVNSEFSPTIAGIFFFTFTAISNRFSHFRISLQHNGGEVVSAFGDVSGYQMASNSALVQMAAGDKVYLTLEEGSLYDISSTRAYTSFTGFRIL